MIEKGRQLLKNKYVRFIGLPIAIFIAFLGVVFTPNTNNTTPPVPSPTPTSSVPQPTSIFHELNARPTQPEAQSLEEAQQQQTEDDKVFQQYEDKLYKEYPWWNSLPLQTDDYFVYFDIDNTSLVGKLYPTGGTTQTADAQVAAMKTDILSQLEKLGVDTNQYPVNWQINPEPAFVPDY